jgi:hypothetical protein
MMSATELRQNIKIAEDLIKRKLNEIEEIKRDIKEMMQMLTEARD